MFSIFRMGYLHFRALSGCFCSEPSIDSAKKKEKKRQTKTSMIKRWFQMFKSQFSIPKKPAISTQNAYFDLWIIDIVRSNYQSQCNTVKR